ASAQSISNTHSWLEISQTRLEKNFAHVKQIHPHAIFAPVLKGNAYGHGLLEIGSIAQRSPSVDWLCVANLSEALLLRGHGITKPIVVLGYIDADLELSINQNIEF